MAQDHKRIDVAHRRTRAANMRRSGHSWQEIADELGYDCRQSAFTDVRRAREQAEAEMKESLAELKETEVDRLDALTAKAWQIMDHKHLALSGGKVVTVGPEGEETELTDDGPALDAIRTLLRIAERRSKLLGLDAPVKVESEGEVHVVVRGEGVNVEDMR